MKNTLRFSLSIFFAFTLIIIGGYFGYLYAKIEVMGWMTPWQEIPAPVEPPVVILKVENSEIWVLTETNRIFHYYPDYECVQNCWDEINEPLSNLTPEQASLEACSPPRPILFYSSTIVIECTGEMGLYEMTSAYSITKDHKIMMWSEFTGTEWDGFTIITRTAIGSFVGLVVYGLTFIGHYILHKTKGLTL